MAYDWEKVEAIRAEQNSARNRRDLNALPTNEVSNEIYNSPSGRSAKIPGLDHWEQMIHKVRAQLIDYIIEHGLVQGFEYDGINEPIKNGKIVITAEMLRRVTDRFGYFKEKETLETIEKYHAEHYFVTDENYVHTDNNFTDAEKTKLEGIADGAEVNKVISVLFNGIETIDPETRVATITITPADIKTWYEQNPDTNVFTDVEKAKLESINIKELSNKVEDVTLDGETVVKNKVAILTAKKIKDSYESNANTNAFTDADKALVEQVLPEVQNKTNQHEQRIDALENTQIAQDAEIKDAKDSITELGDEVNSVAGRVTTLETSQIAQDGRLDALETWKGTTDTTIAALGKTNTAQDGEISKLKEKDTAQDGEISDLKIKNTAQDGRLDALETWKGTTDTTIAALGEKNTAQDGEISKLKEKDTAQDGEISDLKIKNTAQDGRLDALETWKGTTDTTIAALGEKNTAQDGEISKLKERDTAQDGEISNIKIKDTAQDGRLDALETWKDTTDTALTALGEKNTAQDRELSDLKTKDATQDRRLNALETSEATQNADISQLKADVKNAGKVDDVTIDGVSIVVDKVANIPRVRTAKIGWKSDSAVTVPANSTKLFTTQKYTLSADSYLAGIQLINVGTGTGVPRELTGSVVGLETRTLPAGGIEIAFHVLASNPFTIPTDVVSVDVTFNFFKA